MIEIKTTQDNKPNQITQSSTFTMNNDFGFLIIAFGAQRYLNQGITLALSLKKHMPGIPIAIATNGKVDANIFDHIIPIDLTKGGSFIQKMWLDEYTPFKKTLFIDSDCIVGAPFHEHIESMKKFPFTPVCERYLSRSEKDEDLWIEDLNLALDEVGGTVYPKFNGGVYYFDDSIESKNVFLLSRELIPQAQILGLKKPGGGEIGDESVFALALSSLKMLPLYDDKGGLMRTPIGIEGPLNMDKNYSNFSFIKYGKIVTPAICHFAGSYGRPEYLKATIFLNSGIISNLEKIKIDLNQFKLKLFRLIKKLIKI